MHIGIDVFGVQRLALRRRRRRRLLSSAISSRTEYQDSRVVVVVVGSVSSDCDGPIKPRYGDFVSPL